MHNTLRIAWTHRLYMVILLVWLTVLVPAAIAYAKGGTVVYTNGFEKTDGVFAWPGGAVVMLNMHQPKSGASGIAFDPDSNYVAYVYLDLEPGHRYRVSLDYRADRAPLERNGVKVNFNKAGGGNGSAGKHEMSFGSITADNQWHAFEASFRMPDDAVKAQLMLDFYRTTANVTVDNLVVRDLGPSEAAEAEKGPVNPEPAADTPLGKDLSEVQSGWSAWFKPNEATHTFDTEQKRAGDTSIRIEGGTARHMLARKVAVEPGTIYKISFLARTEGDTVGGSAVSFDFFPTNSVPRPYLGLQKLRGDHDWERFTFYGEAPADAKGAYLSLIHNSGKVWFDDIQVEAQP